MLKFLLFFQIVGVSAIYGIVQSCGGWKLEEYPEIRPFLKSKGGVKLYPEIKVKWITHHNPDLVINDKERIDLTEYKSRE